jgi:hypothetical protein
MNFEVLEEYIRFTGPHIKILVIRGPIVEQKILLKLLEMLPNLRSLEIDRVQANSMEDLTLSVNPKPKKIQLLKFNNCAAIEYLLEPLEKCVIKEVELGYWTQGDSELIQKLLKAQQENLKKLTVKFGYQMPSDLKDLRLEYLDFYSSRPESISVEFFREQEGLKVLKLGITDLSDRVLYGICELKNLEILELVRSINVNYSNGLNHLHRLEKLKRLVVPKEVATNILDHLKFGVFQDLEELEACFEGASMESFREMSRITPNLKKIEICDGVALDAVDGLLRNLGVLEKLESVKVWRNDSLIHSSVFERTF